MMHGHGFWELLKNGKAYYSMGYKNFQKTGHYVFYTTSGQIQYTFKTKDTIIKVRTSGEHHIILEQNKFDEVGKFWEQHGEVIVIDGNLHEYKEYFVLGKKVNWNEYKKTRPEDRLKTDLLEAFEN